ncbi:MAG: monovalent cation/H+ antiporter complex subunit F [Spirochaetaceae bacterium]|nr:monovalent cation/H+ antiporter complex subunit F [Spirochaetaceae bacterium]
MASLLFDIAAFIMLISLVLAMVRLLIGPTSADRAVALDAMTIIALSLIGWISLRSGRVIYLDVAMVYGLISFVGVVALARYVERGL